MAKTPPASGRRRATPSRTRAAAAVTSTDVTTSGAAALLDGVPAGTVAPIAAVSRRDRGPDAADSLAAITKAIGARHWASNMIFDWARDPMGSRFRFTRWYMRELVIVDVFAAPNDVNKRDAQRKRAAIERENERRAQSGQAPIGYLPVVRGAMIAYDAFERAKRGEVLEMIERSPEGIRA